MRSAREGRVADAFVTIGNVPISETSSPSAAGTTRTRAAGTGSF
jgi:hypothetical protein